MARLIYSYLISLDGYVADADGDFSWAVPNDEVLDFINELERPVRNYVYGRRMYEMMTGWENDPKAAAQSPGSAAFAAIWTAAEKVVFSKTLEAVTTSRTRLERHFTADRLRALKAVASTDIAVGGATLASDALRMGLVDDVHVFIAPTAVGGGLPMFPNDLKLDLRLEETRSFGNGMTFLRYTLPGT